MARDSNDYTYWRAALKGEKSAISADAPQCGFYKRRLHRGSPWFPVAIWRDDSGEIVCAFQKQRVDPCDQWTWCADNPVTELDYRYHIANGHWRDEPAPTATTANGSNMPMPSDPFDGLKAEIDDKLDQAQNWLKTAPKAPTEIDANMARNMQAALLQLNKRADAMHKAEKQPHLDASRAVDAKFDFRKSVVDVADRLRCVFTSFMKAEEARQRAEAQRKFEEERKKAEETRRVAEEERKRLQEQDPILAHVSEPEPMPELPLAPEPVKIQVGGGVGRRAGLKTVYVGRIADFEKTLQHFANHQQVRDLIQKLVDADVRLNKAQCAIPGVVVDEDRRAA